MITEGSYRIFTLHPISRSKLYLKVELGSFEPPRVIAVPSDGSPEQQVRLPRRNSLLRGADSSKHPSPCQWKLTSSQDLDKPDFFWVTNVSNDLVLTLLSEDQINPDPKSHLVCKIGSLALWRFEKDPNSNQLRYAFHRRMGPSTHPLRRLFSDIGLQPEPFCVTVWFDLNAGSGSCVRLVPYDIPSATV